MRERCKPSLLRLVSHPARPTPRRLRVEPFEAGRLGRSRVRVRTKSEAVSLDRGEDRPPCPPQLDSAILCSAQVTIGSNEYRTKRPARAVNSGKPTGTAPSFLKTGTAVPPSLADPPSERRNRAPRRPIGWDGGAGAARRRPTYVAPVARPWPAWGREARWYRSRPNGITGRPCGPSRIAGSAPLDPKQPTSNRPYYL